MKSHLALVAQVSDISPILAFRSLFPWEGGNYESWQYEPALAVRADATNEACRGLYLAGADSPCLTATLAGDDITIHRAAAEICRDVATILAALGMGRDKGSSSLLKGPGEQLYDRVLNLDSAWVLLRRLRATIAAGTDLIDAARTILQLALDWHVLRTEVSDKGESPARAAREKQIIERAHASSSWGIQGLLSLQLLPDPRGSAIALEMDGFHRMDIAPLLFDWATGSVAAAALATGAIKRPQRGRFDVVPTRVPEKVLGVLNALAIQGNTVRIAGRLEKALYAKVDEVLQALGGFWHTGQQAHVFDTAPGELIEQVVQSGEILLPGDYEFFETQPQQVKQVIDLARIEPGMRVLEPEAGRGALAMAAAEIVGKGRVTCFELMPRNVKHLQDLGFNVKGVQDFLAVEPKPEFDRVILNPPFSGGRDIAHILHAMKFLRPGGRLVAIASTQWRERVTKSTAAFQEMLAALRAEVHDIPRGAFKAAGTDVPTTLIAFNVGATPAGGVAAPAPNGERMEQLAFF